MIRSTGWCVSKCISCVALFAMCVVIAGCGEADWGYVEGTVRLDGEAYGPAIINFKPVDRAAGGGGVGQVDANGHYSIRSSGRKEGIAPGEYMISIEPGTIERVGEDEVKSAGRKLPTKYSMPAESGLLRTVEPKAQTHDFDLES